MASYYLYIFLALHTVLGAEEITTTTPSTFKNGTVKLVVPPRTTLDELLRQYNIQINDAPKREKRETCQISPEILKQLAKGMRDIVNYFPKPGDPALANLETINQNMPETATTCEKIRIKLAHNVQQLTGLYIIMLTNGTHLTEKEYIKVKKMYDSLKNTIKDDFDAIQASLGDDVKTEIAEVIHEKSELENRLGQLAAGIHYNITLQKKLQYRLLELIMSEINGGNIINAKLKFEELGKPDVITLIAEKVTKHENLLAFVRKLPWINQRVAAYKTILNKEKLGSATFSIEHDFKELMNSTNDPKVLDEIKEKVGEVQKLLNIRVEQTIDEFASIISSKQQNLYPGVIKYIENYEAPFNVHIEEIVEKVYAITDNSLDITDLVIRFSRDVKTIAQSGRILLKLYQIMEEYGESGLISSLKISYRLKELIKQNNHKNTPPELKGKMDNFKNTVPKIIRAIVWRLICIKNIGTNAFLQTNDAFDGKRTTINLAPTKTTIKTHSWQIDQSGNGFEIRNVETEDFLYPESTEFSYDKHKRRVFGWRKNDMAISNHLWLLEDLDWRQEKVYIKSQAYQEYLNAQEQNEKPATDDSDIDTLVEKIKEKEGELPEAIQKWVRDRKKFDRLQAFTWRSRFYGPNAGWLLMDASQC